MDATKTEKVVWGICLYLGAAYLVLGLLGFFAWQQSDVFGLVGWSWKDSSAVTFRRIIYSLCAGGLGAMSYSFWQLFEHYCRKGDFDSIWAIWYLFSPISGSLLGIATYATVAGGLLVLGESITLRSNWALFALCYLGGFGAKRVLRKLHTVAGQIFQEAEKVEAEKEVADNTRSAAMAPSRVSSA